MWWRRRTWLQWMNPFWRIERWISFLAFVWLATATLVLYIAFTRDGVKLSALFAIYLLSTVACSLVAVVVYGIDKYRAARERPRISERTLHIIGALGGWPGAHFARRTFRHKSVKSSFRVIFWIIVAVHLTIIALGMMFGWWTDVVRAVWG